MGKSGAERQRELRARRSRNRLGVPEGDRTRSEGERRIEAWVRTSAFLVLKDTADREGITMREALERLLMDADVTCNAASTVTGHVTGNATKAPAPLVSKTAPAIGKAPHPSDVLQSIFLPAAGKTINALAEHVGIRRQTLYKLTNGGGVSKDMAHRLGKAFGNGPLFWLLVQLLHDLAHGNKIELDKFETLDMPEPAKLNCQGFADALFDKFEAMLAMARQKGSPGAARPSDPPPMPKKIKKFNGTLEK